MDIDGIWVEELLPAAFEGASYVYDGDGSLVKSEVNGVVTYYLGKYYEKTVQNGHTAEKKHYSAGSSMIAVRTVIDGTQDTLNWLVGDHLGSTSLVTDSTGVVVNEVRYSAFGEMRYLNGETVTDLLYTGQRLQDELGLYFYGARWYDNYLNRFLSPDSIIPDPTNTLDYDRYSYVRNNPLRYSDPTGNNPWDFPWDDINDFVYGFTAEVILNNFGFDPRVQTSVDYNTSESNASVAGRMVGDVFSIAEGFLGVAAGLGIGGGGIVLTGPGTLGVGAVVSAGTGAAVAVAGGGIAVNAGGNLGANLYRMGAKKYKPGDFSYQKSGHADDVQNKGFHIDSKYGELSILAEPDGAGGYTWKVTTWRGDPVSSSVQKGAVQFITDNPKKAIETANGIITNYSWNPAFADRVNQAKNLINALSK